jgi:mercuric reductase
MDIDAALDRLNSLLPLKARQDRLDPVLRKLHRAILEGFFRTGNPLSREQLSDQLGNSAVDAALQQLASDDLIVLGPDRRQLAGVYPFTTEERVHRVLVNGHTVHAMCALDALSVAPMFNTATRVDSRCHVTGAPIEIHMQGTELLSALPADPYVGIRWQGTSGCAAQSLCLEMLFLRDRATALAWQQEDIANMSIFDLPAAVAFGAAFFTPLLQDLADV